MEYFELHIVIIVHRYKLEHYLTSKKGNRQTNNPEQASYSASYNTIPLTYDKVSKKPLQKMNKNQKL
jgi:hypothetical protein